MALLSKKDMSSVPAKEDNVDAVLAILFMRKNTQPSPYNKVKIVKTYTMI